LKYAVEAVEINRFNRYSTEAVFLELNLLLFIINKLKK